MERFMTPSEPLRDAVEPFDEDDVEVLDQLRAAFDERDPVPEGLTDWVTLALSLDVVDVQIARLSSEPLALATRASEDTAHTITFENNDVTVMLRLEEHVDAHLRVDGWIAPAGAYDVEIRTGERILSTVADEFGRFAFDQVARGLAHVVLRPHHAQQEGGRAIVTQPVFL
jgi:hypothetical protein